MTLYRSAFDQLAGTAYNKLNKNPLDYPHIPNVDTKIVKLIDLAFCLWELKVGL